MVGSLYRVEFFALVGYFYRAEERAAGFLGEYGVFGAAAAVGRLLGLDVEKMQAALGIATSFAAGQWSFVHDGAQNKRLHVGNAAHGGLLACLLAREGFTGPKLAFEQVWGGFSKTFAPTSQDPDAWLRDLGKNWKLGRVSIKPHASCRSSHSSIDAVNEKFGGKAVTLASAKINSEWAMRRDHLSPCPTTNWNDLMKVD